MTFSGHLAVTALSLGATHDPYVVIPLNLFLHFATDAIPHAELNCFDTATPLRKAVQGTDLLVTVALLAGILHMHLPVWLTASSAIMGLLPDLTDRLIRRYWPAARLLHRKMHTWPMPADKQQLDWSKTVTGPTPLLLKVIFQAVLIGCALLMLRAVT